MALSLGAFAAALALLNSAGHDSPLLYPGPLCGGESGSTGRAAGIGMDADAFSPAHGDGMDAGVEATQERLPDVLSKSPAPAHGLAGQEARQAPSGVAFLFGYLSLWPRKEKVTRPPKEDESSSALNAKVQKCRSDDQLRC